MVIEVSLVGKLPLIVHSQRGMNPRDPVAQQLSELQSKRNKTLSDREAISDLEFELGLYWDARLGPYIPYLNVKRCIQDGGKQLKLGTLVEQSLRPCIGYLEFPIIYQGPRDMAGLKADVSFRDVRSVKVPPRTGKVVERTRPIFKDWKIVARFLLDTERLDLRKLQDCIKRAGDYVGLQEYRPEYGIFEGTVIEAQEG